MSALPSGGAGRPAIIRTRSGLERRVRMARVPEHLSGVIRTASRPVSAAAKWSKEGTKQFKGLTIQNADLSRARAFRWAWEQRILTGYLNLLIGEEGIGKGNLVAWIAARITRGELPGDLQGRPRRVLFIGSEDAWDHVWAARLEVAGADLSKVVSVKSGPSGAVDVRKDADVLQEYIKEARIAFTYFDQLLDNLGIADSWKDQDVRNALAPLIAVAKETDSAMLATMHPNKRGGSFRERISGSPAFNALSRSSLFVAKHPDEPGRVVLARGKGNYSIEPDAFEFRIEEKALNLKNPTRVIKTSHITAIRETRLTKDDLLDARPRKREDSQVGRARTLLSEMFSDGENRPAREVLDHLSEAYDIPERSVQRAREDLEINKWQEGFQGPWIWGWVRPKIKVKRSRKEKRQ